jgi:hypothetical protein
MCYRFTLVRAPEQLALAREAARVAQSDEGESVLRDLQPERIALQRQRVDFGGSLSEEEYTRQLAALERAVRRKMPARARRCRR